MLDYVERPGLRRSLGRLNGRDGSGHADMIAEQPDLIKSAVDWDAVVDVQLLAQYPMGV